MPLGAEQFDPKERILKQNGSRLVAIYSAAEQFDPKERILKQQQIEVDELRAA